MAVNDQDRLDLHGRLEEVLGQGHGSTLMRTCRPRLSRVATKQDVVAALAATATVIVAAVRP